MCKLFNWMAIIIAFSILDITKAYLKLDWDAVNPAFDPKLYENALNSTECEKQLQYLTQRDNLILRLQFLESGPRVPRSIQSGNTMDWGNYHQCLDINEEIEDMLIEGKYCSIRVPSGQNVSVDSLDWIDFNPNHLVVDEETENIFKTAMAIGAEDQTMIGTKNNYKRTAENGAKNIDFTLAVCIPKPCSTREGINKLIFNLTGVNFQYEDIFYRAKNDKPWVPVDYVAVVLLSVVIILSLLSTSYDFWHQRILKSDPKAMNKIYQSFSVFTNGRRLLTFNTNPGALECVDGIRAIAMIWVILGHTFSTLPPRLNLLDSVNWTLSIDSIWITSAPISVDTFFMISGLLLVYTTAEKISGMKLLQNIHLFYLNRLLRMFPLLAAAVLIQASILFRIADGPMWDTVAKNTEDCRKYWWSTLLYMQNFANTSNMCLDHTWYLAIDMHLHILSPLILFWVLSGNKKKAWVALISSLLLVLTGATIYNFMMNFPSAVIQPARQSEHSYYMSNYYTNTLTRASPFFVGMIFGYLLHLYRVKNLILSKLSVLILWIVALVLSSLVIYSCHPMKDMNWNNQTLDSLINSYIRPTWALTLGWMILACTHGYGGPINWFLSLNMWKLPSRLSYGMYLFHYPIMFVTAGTAVAPIFYSTISTFYRFLAELSAAMLVSFAMTLIIDSPFSTLIKLVMGGGPKQQDKTRHENKAAGDEKLDYSYKKDRTIDQNILSSEIINKTQL